MMDLKSIIDEALNRAELEGRTAPPGAMENDDDLEDRRVRTRAKENDDDLAAVLEQLTTVIRVVGCGGGGSNTIERLAETGIEGAELFAMNTDAQHLLHISADRRVLIGRRTTRGLGAGSLPSIGEEAARESITRSGRRWRGLFRSSSPGASAAGPEPDCPRGVAGGGRGDGDITSDP